MPAWIDDGLGYVDWTDVGIWEAPVMMGQTLADGGIHEFPANREAGLNGAGQPDMEGT